MGVIRGQPGWTGKTFGRRLGRLRDIVTQNRPLSLTTGFVHTKRQSSASGRSKRRRSRYENPKVPRGIQAAAMSSTPAARCHVINPSRPLRALPRHQDQPQPPAATSSTAAKHSSPLPRQHSSPLPRQPSHCHVSISAHCHNKYYPAKNPFPPKSPLAEDFPTDGDDPMQDDTPTDGPMQDACDEVLRECSPGEQGRKCFLRLQREGPYRHPDKGGDASR